MSRHRQRRCGGKRRFRDEYEAERALTRIRRTSTRTRIPSRSYFCGRCNGWHVTSQELRA